MAPHFLRPTKVTIQKDYTRFFFSCLGSEELSWKGAKFQSSLSMIVFILSEVAHLLWKGVGVRPKK